MMAGFIKPRRNPIPAVLADGVLTSAGSRDRVHRFDEERGAILPLMAILIVVLMGAAAMAIDLGYLYWRSIEIQHGADAAALAGVIYEPDYRTEAHTEGIAAAIENGFTHDPGNGNSIEIVDFIDDPTAVDHSAQLRATITQRVNTFFLRLMGLESVDISRTAVAIT